MRRLTPFTATKPANSLVRSSVSRMISALIDATPPGCCMVRTFGTTVQPQRSAQSPSYAALAGRCGSNSLTTRKDFLGPRHDVHPGDFYSMDYEASQHKWGLIRFMCRACSEQCTVTPTRAYAALDPTP